MNISPVIKHLKRIDKHRIIGKSRYSKISIGVDRYIKTGGGWVYLSETRIFRDLIALII